jgi:hypothetical protein
MAVILETVPLGAAGRKGQYRIQTIKSLDGALLVTQKTAACTGGLRYNPMMSAAFSSNVSVRPTHLVERARF